LSVIKKSRKRLVPEELNQLAPLISQWDMARRSIATLVEGPTNIGELGETIAFSIFDMEPARRGQPGHDGHFLSGPLAPKTVNVKTYNSFNWTIDFDPLGRHPVDYYLVLAGLPPASSKAASRSYQSPFAIGRVFLLSHQAVLEGVAASYEARGARFVADNNPYSLRQEYWLPFEIWPALNNPHPPLVLTTQQRELLMLFSWNALSLLEG
jgi:hypothetical protein